MNYKRYTHYKPSNVDWLGDIPAHWEVRKLKYVATANDETLSEKTNPNTVIKYVDIGNVDSLGNILEVATYLYKDAPSRARRITQKGDVIISTVRTYLKAIAEIKQENLIVSTGFAVLRPQLNIITNSFLYLALQADYFIHKITASSVGVGYPAINLPDLVSLKIPLPPLLEQTAIVTYLNRKLADIDTFIAKKQRLITLLQEQKAAMINKAVTKGLNEQEMRPSGIAWLGDIPTHWEVRKLKYVATFNPSKALALKGVDMNEEVVFLPMEKVSEDGKIDNSIKKPIHEVANGYTFFEKGDIIYAKITPCFENGKGAYLNKLETNKGFGSTEFTVLRPNLKFIHGAYLQYILQSKFFRKIGERFMEGAAGQKRVSTDFVKNFTIGVPSPTEQIAIVSHIEAESARIDKAIQLIERELTLVQEYRTALIAEAVTGKIDCTP